MQRPEKAASVLERFNRRAGVADDLLFVSADGKTGGRCGRFFGGSAVISERC